MPSTKAASLRPGLCLTCQSSHLKCAALREARGARCCDWCDHDAGAEEVMGVAARLERWLGRANSGGLDEWSPGSDPVKALETLGAALMLENTGPTEALMSPAAVFRTGGGDWDDIAALLMALGRRAGLESRVSAARDQRRPHLLTLRIQVKSVERGWVPVGPIGCVSAPAPQNEGTD